MFSRGRFRVGDKVYPAKTGEIVTGEFYRTRTKSQYACPLSNRKIDGKEIRLPIRVYTVREIVRTPTDGLHLRFAEAEGTFHHRYFDLFRPVYKPGDKVVTSDYWSRGPYTVEGVREKGHRTYLRLEEFPEKENEYIFYRRTYAALP